MHRTWMIAYPWDITDDDLSAVLDRLHGEMGITGLSLWTATPAVTQLRNRDIEPRIFRTRGGLFFHPSDEQYEGTRCKPIRSDRLKGASRVDDPTYSKDLIEKIVNACAQRGLELSLIVSAALTGRLVQRHPEMACKNIFDDVSHMSLCLTNPDVQSYLNGLISDITSRYNPAAVIITDFFCAWMEAYNREIFVGSMTRPTSYDPQRQTASPIGDLEPTTWSETALLAMCFCESCHQRASQAGVDVDMARRSVKVMLQNSPAGADVERGVAVEASFDRVGQRSSLSLPFPDHSPVSAYDQWRREELSTLLKRICDTCTCELLVDRGVHDASAGTGKENLCPPLASFDVSIPDGVIEYLDHPDQLDSVFQTGAPSGARKCRHDLLIPHTFTMGTHGPELVGLISRAVESGYTGVHFDHYGLLPDTALTNIKQAIRFARRMNEE